MPEGTELAGALPPALGGGGASGPGASPGGPIGMPIGEDVEPAEGAGGMDIEEMGELCGDIYADVFGVAGEFYVGVPVALPEDRAARRGKQIAVVLRKLGWEDDEILCYVGLTAGVAGDFAMLYRAKQEVDAQKAAQKARDDAAAAPAASSGGGGPPAPPVALALASSPPSHVGGAPA